MVIERENMQQSTINFSVDAKLLQELGERLVGKPHIALGELVKNSYDADSEFIEICFYPEKDIGLPDGRGEIIVKDGGHGMSFDDFRDFWMRIGTTHKHDKKLSPYHYRQMTGSKGVGRLSVQFLAHRLELKTVPKQQGEMPYWIWAFVDWDEAVKSGDLTSATVVYEIRTDPPPFETGTELRLEWLKQSWSETDLKNLAREIWWLQPPFQKDNQSLPPAERFEIRFVGNEEAFDEFNNQLDAILKIQMARIVGKYEEGQAKIAIEFWERGSRVDVYPHEFSLSDIGLDEHRHRPYNQYDSLQHANFEIRVYKSEGRQVFGIRVDELREYLDRFAGVQLYDGPFRLPYYGEPENDWLGIEYDHAHRTFISKLLPHTIQNAFKETERLRYLPTLRRLIGTVRISTAKEMNLEILITRDRLVQTQAHDDLRDIVRYALDLYAYHAARKAAQVKSRFNKTERPDEIFREVENILAEYKPRIPQDVYQPLQNSLIRASKSIQTTFDVQKEDTLSHLSLLAPLATAGMSALTIQHELRKQFGNLQHIIVSLREIRTGFREMDERIEQVIYNLSEWLNRAQTTSLMFDYMTGETIRESQRYRAKNAVEKVLEQMTFMSLGVEVIANDLDADLYLPSGSFAEWGAIFQNVFSNAFNAMVGMRRKLLAVSSQAQGHRRTLLIQDTGKGVDLEKAPKLFQPFERGTEYDPVRMRLGYGGTGLGLTIVKLLTDKVGCSARFVHPESGFSTAFALEWDEKIADRKAN